MTAATEVVVAALVAAGITAALGGIYIARVETGPMLPGVSVVHDVGVQIWTPSTQQEGK